jgi:hypothetical protein
MGEYIIETRYVLKLYVHTWQHTGLVLFNVYQYISIKDRHREYIFNTFQNTFSLQNLLIINIIIVALLVQNSITQNENWR